MRRSRRGPWLLPERRESLSKREWGENSGVTSVAQVEDGKPRAGHAFRFMSEAASLEANGWVQRKGEAVLAEADSARKNACWRPSPLLDKGTLESDCSLRV